MDVNPTLSYTIPSSGYLYIYYQDEAWAFKDIMASVNPHAHYSLFVCLFRDGNYIRAFAELKGLTTNANNNVLIPVSKGDIVYYGTWYDYDTLPSGYKIIFYPGKGVDAKTGD